MGRIAANGIDIEYETFGDATDPAMLLVSGYTAQMSQWDPKLCALLAARGFYVIRFDNRDVGLSTHFDGVEVDMAAVVAGVVGKGEMPTVPYTLSAFSDDAFGLLAALGIPRAHVVGGSMGGMIVQVMAIEHPERLLSMTSIMSMTGEPAFGASSPEARTMLMRVMPPDRAAYLDASVEGARVYSTHRHFSEAAVRARAALDFDRAYYPEGATRQYAAILASGQRVDALREVTVPTLVLHGREDQLITLSGGVRTAEVIPGATLLVLADMGHDLPEPVWPIVVDAITSHAVHADLLLRTES
jgi:pimeloyl-ACP methyl ester carboxylesterase